MKLIKFILIFISLITTFNSSVFGIPQLPYDPSAMLTQSEFYLGSIVINSSYPNISYQIAKNGYQLFSNTKLKSPNNPLGKNILAQLTVSGPQGMGISYQDAKLSNDRLLDDKGTLKLNQSDNTGINLMGLQLQYAGPTSSANNINVQSIGDPTLITSANLFAYKFFQQLPQFIPGVVTGSQVTVDGNLTTNPTPTAYFFLNLYFDPTIGEVHIDSIDAFAYVQYSYSPDTSKKENLGEIIRAVMGFAPQLVHIEKQDLINNNIIVEQGQ